MPEASVRIRYGHLELPGGSRTHPAGPLSPDEAVKSTLTLVRASRRGRDGGAPGGGRTHTGTLLRGLPLPVGLRGRGGECRGTAAAAVIAERLAGPLPPDLPRAVAPAAHAPAVAGVAPVRDPGSELAGAAAAEAVLPPTRREGWRVGPISDRRRCRDRSCHCRRRCRTSRSPTCPSGRFPCRHDTGRCPCRPHTASSPR